MAIFNWRTAVALIVGLAGCTGQALADQARILTAPPGTVPHTSGSAIASVVSQKNDFRMIAIPMAGPQIFVPQVDAGQGDFTIINSADAYGALRGIKPAYQKAYSNLRLVSIGFSNDLGMVTAQSSDIKSAADLKGKRVTGVFSALRTCQELSTAQLANAGLSWDDVQVVPVTNARDGVQALAAGRVDVALCAPVGQAVLQEINAQTPIRFISMDESPEAVQRVREHFPTGEIVRHKAGSSVGLVEDVAVWNYPFYLVAHKDADADMVYAVTRTIAESIEQLRGISVLFRSWNPERMVDEGITIPVHDGAKRYFQEQGKWTAAVQAAHDKNLGELR